SMSPEVMDRRATLAMTKSLFKVRLRYRTRYGGPAMTMSLFKVRLRYWAGYGGLAMTASATFHAAVTGSFTPNPALQDTMTAAARVKRT
ncbi:hypothetical protein, partial [Rhodoferax sp.]|uniref:hypothetical protein n=1 Tax=Rhodoferax sp. TaxID=50421 RepID=UPI0025D99D54